MGLVDKPGRYAYRYSLTDPCRRFFERLRDSGSVEDFVMNRMFSAWNETTGAGAIPEEGSAIIRAAVSAFDELKSPLKFAPILETLLLAAIRTFADRRRYFELGQAASLLRALQKQEPHWLSFNIDRRGNLKYLRFESNEVPPSVGAGEGGNLATSNGQGG